MVTFLGSGGRRIAAVARDNGRFRVNLPSGIYAVTGTSPRFDDGEQQCTSEAPVVVSAGRTVTVDVSCHRA
jgi:hypothetical protein